MGDEEAMESKNESGLLQAIRRQRENPVAEIFRNSPFLFLSLIFHLIIFAMLAFFIAREPERVKREIALNIEEVKVEDVQHQVPRKEENLSESATSGALSSAGGGVEGESHKSASKGTEDVSINRLNVLGLKSAVGGGGTGQFQGVGGDSFAFAGGRGEKSIEGAVDQFAIVTINAVSRGNTLVALMIDRSRSVVYGDLPRLIQRMDHYFDEIDKNLSSNIRDNGRWIVVGYGREAEFKCHPSANLSYVKSALRNVNVGVSGMENVGKATEKVLDRFGGQYDHILIAALTDESGNDIKNGKLLERLVQRMRGKNARFYTFGYEATFCARKKRIRFKLDPELMRGQDRNAIRGFEGRVIHGWADGGPEAPKPELWWGQNWHRWHRWGGHLNDIPSGFGMYGLNRLVLATGGIYFLMKPESKYDEQKLYAKYKPDICSKAKYELRKQNRDIRRILNATWKEIGRFYLPYHLHKAKDIERELRAAAKGRQYCADRIRALSRYIENQKMKAPNPVRWRAHADLTLAELYRLHFMLGQYHDVVEQTWEKHNRAEIPKGKRLVVHRGKAPSDYVGPQQAKVEFNTAKQYIQLVIDNHRDTPWETAAKRMKKHLFPWRCTLRKIPKHKGRPSPPSLQF
ncbi:MAG: vWA domain-containing protein [Candidatus Brocadiia bacterium]